MKCGQEFNPGVGGMLRCPRCQRGIQPDEARDCPEDASACVHRGAEVGRDDCSSCAGRVAIKVFTCTLHGRCSFINAGLQNVRACAECGDRLP